MSDDTFTEPEDSSDEWVDVRMSDPDEEEWDLDLVVVDGTVQYVDLRIRPELLASFAECLLDDVGDRRASTVLTKLAGSQDIDPGDLGDDGSDSEGDG